SERTTILIVKHDSPIAGHYGIRKTKELVSCDYWWPKMTHDIKSYVKSCDVCQRAKHSHRKQSGLLQPLSVPSDRWKSVTIDFMVELPECQGFNAIMVVVDRFTKMSHFIPCKIQLQAKRQQHYTSTGSGFWKSFWNAIGTEPLLSTAYHPETDGQMERVNSVLNQYLRIFCSYMQDDWVPLLATAEFSYNNSIHTATGTTPFFANQGLHPNAGSGSRSISDDPNILAVKLREYSDFLQSNLERAHQDMKRFADRHRSAEPDYKPGDKVLLSTKNFTTSRPKPKWADKWMGFTKMGNLDSGGWWLRGRLYQQLWDQSVTIISELNCFCCLAFCKNHHQEYQETFQTINPTAHRVLSEHNASSYSVNRPKCDLENVAYNSCLLATTLG
ncbi:retrotransposable element protein, partial [Planoprotostelium fungivorum]